MKTDCYLFIVQILQRFLPAALPDLHLPRLGDVGLPVDDSPLTPAPTRWQRVKVERLVIRGAFHRAEHAAEFLPRPGGAVGAHVLEEGWYFPGGRHALSGWSVGGKKTEFSPYFLLYRLVQPPPFRAQVDALQRKWKAHERCKNSHSVIYRIIWAQPTVSPATSKQFGIAYSWVYMSLQQAADFTHRQIKRERETSCLWKQRSSIGNRRRMFTDDGITSGTPRRPLLSRVKPEL